MPKIKRSKGPWYFSGHPNGYQELISGEGSCIVRSYGLSEEREFKDIRRITACLNACEGVKTKDLNKGKFQIVEISYLKELEELLENLTSL